MTSERFFLFTEDAFLVVFCNAKPGISKNCRAEPSDISHSNLFFLKNNAELCAAGTATGFSCSHFGFFLNVFPWTLFLGVGCKAPSCQDNTGCKKIYIFVAFASFLIIQFFLFIYLFLQS